MNILFFKISNEVIAISNSTATPQDSFYFSPGDDIPASTRVCPPLWQTLAMTSNTAFPPHGYGKCATPCINDPTCNMFAYNGKMCLTSTECIPVDCVNCLIGVNWKSPINASYSHSSQNGKAFDIRGFRGRGQ